jgi:hypothetical protein
LCIVWHNIYLVWNIKTIASIARRGLLKATVVWLPFGSADNWLIIIDGGKLLLVFAFLKNNKVAIILTTQMIGTFMPLVFLPEVTFQSNNILLLH